MKLRIRQTLLKTKSSGQAMVEYVLVLFVVVSVLAGAVWQLNDAFGQWAESYFGAYLQCLLEVGELPSLSSSGDNQCDQAFEPFSFAKGRPLKMAAGGSGGGLGSPPSGS